jgi:hypothetical protein
VAAFCLPSETSRRLVAQPLNRVLQPGDGIRAGKPNSAECGPYVFCQADKFQQLFLLERAFRAPSLTPAVKKELNLMRRNSMVGEALLKALARLYQQHSLGERTDPQRQGAEQPIPRMVCSEALT